MSKIGYYKLAALFVCLIVTSAFLQMQPEGQAAQHRQSLNRALDNMSPWQEYGHNNLSTAVIRELKLDDYIFQTYKKGDDLVTLYVGYYYSGKKIGAAHDPQVCYPGQGWVLSGKENRSYPLDNQKSLEFSRIVAELDNRKEEIFYWFQVDDRSTSNTFEQKLLLFQKKLLGQGEGNAFIRISTSLDNKSATKAQSVLLDFIDQFYPLFIRYVSEKA